ncbi:hypothetical protein C8R45DRAFT_979256 [Mycena sanguinolenta]|nr:hypothetical protein C8R45DRAFT_979256 [Mycena sanguinolenta]
MFRLSVPLICFTNHFTSVPRSLLLGDSLHLLYPKFLNDLYACLYFYPIARRLKMSSAIPHVVSFLTRPLLPAFSYAAVSSAQLILSASLAAMPSATLSLAPTSMPAPLLAASVGATIPWAAWLSALGSDNITLFYGPGYVKVRFGNAAMTNVWSETSQGSVLPISRAQVSVKVGPSPLLQQNTGARLRAMLLSARVRNMRRHAAAAEPTSSSDDADFSDSDSDLDSDSASSTSSKFTSHSNDSLTSVGSSPTTPPKSAPIALPTAGVYRPPFARAKTAAKTVAVTAKAVAVKSSPPPAANHLKKDTTAYLYQGGVTRVMTGGVMLGPRRS